MPHDEAVRAHAAWADARPGTARVRAIDADVRRHVQRELVELLDARVARAFTVSETFGRDLAQRVARFTLDGGKRVRPQFLWWGLRACGTPDGEQADAALRLGAALELIQTCALVHDDIMDASPVRRGRPAVHVDLATAYPGRAHGAGHFGRSAAILAGDLALAWADDEFAALLARPRRRDGALRDAWSRMRLEMVAGQYLDVQGEFTRCRSIPRAVRVACLKTALYTVERPLHLGALLGGAPDDLVRALCSAGRCTGLAFQLRNDLNDVFGGPDEEAGGTDRGGAEGSDAERAGAAHGGDIRSGKPTYLLALAQARAEARADRHALEVLRRCVGRADLDAADLDDVRRVLEDTGAVRLVEDEIDSLLGRARHHLRTARIDPVAHEGLLRLTHAAGGERRTPAAAPPPHTAPRGPSRRFASRAVEGVCS